jgi:hypothetical protein
MHMDDEEDDDVDDGDGYAFCRCGTRIRKWQAIACPVCGAPYITQVGSTTERPRVEEEKQHGRFR